MKEFLQNEKGVIILEIKNMAVKLNKYLMPVFSEQGTKSFYTFVY